MILTSAAMSKSFTALIGLSLLATVSVSFAVGSYIQRSLAMQQERRYVPDSCVIWEDQTWTGCQQLLTNQP